MSDYLFVYGSLRRQVSSSRHDLIQDQCEYIGEGTLQGKLYLLDGYPGAIISEDDSDTVFGEMYRMLDRDSLFARLDEYEECTGLFPEPHEFKREEVEIALVDGQRIVGWSYFYNRPITHLKRVISGRF